MASFRARFESPKIFRAGLVSSLDNAFHSKFSVAVSPIYYPIYDGPTDIIPLVREDQRLDTSEKLVEDDILVREIPSAEVSNIFGGTTFIIGG